MAQGKFKSINLDTPLIQDLTESDWIWWFHFFCLVTTSKFYKIPRCEAKRRFLIWMAFCFFLSVFWGNFVFCGCGKFPLLDRLAQDRRSPQHAPNGNQSADSHAVGSRFNRDFERRWGVSDLVLGRDECPIRSFSYSNPRTEVIPLFQFLSKKNHSWIGLSGVSTLSLRSVDPRSIYPLTQYEWSSLKYLLLIFEQSSVDFKANGIQILDTSKKQQLDLGENFPAFFQRK